MTQPWPESFGPYRVIGELGRGGMGVVLRARRDDLGRDFALKVIRTGEDASEEALERFRRESRAAALLSDYPGIVGVHDVGEANGTVYFAMDLVEGSSLDDAGVVSELTLQQLATVLAEAARAVHHAHTFGMLHRDVKPANILVDREGHARLTDFGLVKAQSEVPGQAGLTHSGQVVGTPAYMSPEQAAGDPLDVRSDVWGLGATLYALLAGRPPFEGETVVNVLAKLMSEDAAPPSKFAPHVARELDTITLKCLSREVDGRYTTALELAEDLERFARGDEILAKPLGLFGKLARSVHRHRPMYVMAGVAALLVAGVAGWFVFQNVQERARTEARAQAKDEARVGSALEFAEKLIAVAPAQAMGAVESLAQLSPDHPKLPELRARATEAAEAAKTIARLQQAALFADEADRLRTEWEALHDAKVRKADETEARDRSGVSPAELIAIDAANQRWEEVFTSARGNYFTALRLIGEEEAETLRRRVLRGIAELAARRLVWADRMGATVDQRRFKKELDEHGTESHAKLISGVGSFAFDTDPSGLEVWVYQYNLEGGILQPVNGRKLGTTPLAGIPAGMGSYLLRVSRDGEFTAEYPLLVHRAEDVTLPGPVRVFTKAELGPGYKHVPAGWTYLGDGAAPGSVPRRRVWVDGFFMAELEVSFRQYRDFLEAMERTDMPAEELRALCPRMEPERGYYWNVDSLGALTGFGRMNPKWPMFGISWDNAQAYCAWRSKIEGRSVRLPTNEEWSRAARGADLRSYPASVALADEWISWGRHPSHNGDPQAPLEVGSGPNDVSPFGIRDLVGSVREWCGGTVEGQIRARPLRGATWGATDESMFRIEARFRADHREVSGGWGFRVVADLPTK